ncbi:MAG: SPOR domain-containing protein [Longicatena sp.]
MENKKLLVLFGIGFSIIFSLLYYFLFSTMLISNVEKRTLYMNQVGLYKQEDSIKEMKGKLEKAGLTSYVVKQGDAKAVVCNVSSDVKETKEGAKKLKTLKFNYIQKKVSVENNAISKLIDNKEYAKALEGIGK